MSYNREYFLSREQLTRASASRVIAVLKEHVPLRSVLDTGCANGLWLSAFADAGTESYLGVDGPWVDDRDLRIPADRFMRHDLSRSLPTISDRYDLAASIEVAEHLPEDMAAPFVKFLTSRSDLVLFSAAIKMQGGTGHVNEQPQSYWADLFAKQGFVAADIIRPRIWDDPSVNVIYKQNMLLYVQSSSQFAEQFRDQIVSSTFYLDRVHHYLYQIRVARNSERRGRIRSSAKRVMRRLGIGR